MKAGNFPGRVKLRRIGALARMKDAKLPDSSVFESPEKHDKWLEKRRAEMKILEAKISSSPV
jgi:hypothetical protein